MSKEYTWFDIEKLPSGWLSYPENASIKLRPYSFGDVLSLARAAETGIGALDKILSGIRCNFDKELLLPADILYLGIYRKLVSTKHSKIEFTVECPVCAKENKKVMELTELKFKEIEIPKLPIRAKLEAGTLEFMPITLGKYREVLKKFNGAPDWLLAFSVQNMDPGEARDIIMNAVDIDKEVLDEVADLLNFGLLPIEFECQDEFCDNIITVNLESPETVVMPFRESGESYQDRIEFGNEPRSKRSGDSGD